MLSITLNIAHLHIRIHCTEPDCSKGIEALIALYKRCEDTVDVHLCFTIQPTTDGAMLDCDGEQIWKGKEAGEVVAAFEWAFYNHIIAMLYPSFVSLHAATVDWQGHGITFGGTSGAGKSSLCTAALLHGANYLSDEYSLLDKEGSITPFPRPLQWDNNDHPAFSRQDMHDSGLFGEGSYAFTGHDGQPVTSLLWHPRHLGNAPAKMSLLILPRFDASIAAVQVDHVLRSQALMELAEEMHHKLPVQERLRELHRRIPETTRMVRLVFPDVHQAWTQVEQLLPND
jgi:hypothetical protein